MALTLLRNVANKALQTAGNVLGGIGNQVQQGIQRGQASGQALSQGQVLPQQRDILPFQPQRQQIGQNLQIGTQDILSSINQIFQDYSPTNMNPQAPINQLPVLGDIRRFSRETFGTPSWAKPLDEQTPEDMVYNALDFSPIGVGRVTSKVATPLIEDFVRSLPRRAKDTMNVTPEGIVFRTNKQPRTTNSLDKVIEQVKNVNPQTGRIDDTLQITAGEARQALPQPKVNVTLSQLRTLVNRGDNLDGVTFLPRNVDEAREAIKLGLDANKINITSKTGRPLSTLFSSDKGIGRTTEPLQEFLDQSIKSGGAKTTKALNWVTEKTLEPARAIPKMMGDLSDDVNRAILEPFYKAKGDSAVFKKEWFKKISEAVPFKSGSKESAAIQQFGEGLKTADDLVAEFGDDTAKKIMESDTFFRQAYDTILDIVNQRRLAAGLPQIAKRQDYYRHFNEGAKSWLDTLLTGNTGSSSLSESIMKTRKGDKTIYDAVGGFGDYLDRAGRAGFTDEFATRIQKLGSQLQEAGADPRVNEYLQKYAREGILGQREVRDLGTVGNVIVNAAKTLGRTVKMNQVVGNARSLVMQAANIPTAVGKVIGTDPKGSIYITKGLTNLVKNRKAMAQSPFLQERGFFTPSQFMRPGKANINRITNVGGRALQESDMMATRYIWNTFYEQALGNKVANPIRYADDLTKQMVAGRGIGDLSPAQSSDMGSLVFPFGVEWANSAHALGDMIGKKEYGGLLATVAAYHGFNKVLEKTTGNPGLFDPIQAVFDSYEYWEGSEDKEQNGVKAVGRLIAEMANVSPYTQNILAIAYPVAETLGAPDSRDVFGSDDPTRFGNVSLYSPLNERGELRSPMELAAKFTPTGYGQQAKKTIEGLLAGARGYTKSAAGNIHHAVSQDPLSRLQMALFGQWGTSATREHFGSDYSEGVYDEDRAAVEALPPDQRPDFIRQLNENKRTENREKAPYAEKEDNVFTKLFGGEEAPSFDKVATTKEGKKAQKDALDAYMEAGGDLSNVSEDVIITHLFDGTTYDKADRKQKASILNELDKIASRDDLDEEAKVKIAQASGVDANDLQYYRISSLDQIDRMEMFLEYAGQDFEDRNELLVSLALAKRSVGGKSLSSSTIIDRLYDDNLISKEEKTLLTNIKFDPINNKFYMDRDYKPAGSGGLSASQIRSYITAINNIFKVGGSGSSMDFLTKLPKLPEPPKLDLRMRRRPASTLFN